MTSSRLGAAWAAPYSVRAGPGQIGSRATIITSQLAPNKWHERLGEPTFADAVFDRLLHGADKIALKGPSKRTEDVAES